jgi:subtilisin
MPAQPDGTKSIIVTFKPKDKRADKKKDKTEIVRAAIERSVSLFDARSVTPEALRGLDPAEIGYDINEYEAPIVTLQVTEKEAAALRKDPNVASVEDDGLMYALAMGYDTGALLFENQPTVQAETVPAGINRIKAPLAWDVTRGKGVKVAVLDTGIDFNHPDLASNYRGGVSFVPDETSPMDYNRHGTHCAGIIAAALNGGGVVGVAPAAYLYAVKVLPRSGSGNWSWLIAGLDWCINNGTHIASMSLGGAAPTAVGTMCDLAFARGVLLVAAAGNSAGPVEHPAKYASVIAVSAIDVADQLASFSCRGPEVELCAPGVDVLSTVPGGGYAGLSGTSMACPHVSGAAALAWSTHRFPPGGLRRNVAIRRLLATTADNLGAPGRDNNFGFGRVDAEQAAFQFAVPPAVPGIP